MAKKMAKKKKRNLVLFSICLFALILTVSSVGAFYTMIGKPLSNDLSIPQGAPGFLNDYYIDSDYVSRLPYFYSINLDIIDLFPIGDPCVVIPNGDSWWYTYAPVDDGGLLHSLGYNKDTHYLLRYTSRNSVNTEGRLSVWWEKSTDKPVAAIWAPLFDIFCNGDPTLEYDPTHIPVDTGDASLASLPIDPIDMIYASQLIVVAIVSLVILLALVAIYYRDYKK